MDNPTTFQSIFAGEQNEEEDGPSSEADAVHHCIRTNLFFIFNLAHNVSTSFEELHEAQFSAAHVCSL
jgi:hypothetical protein